MKHLPLPQHINLLRLSDQAGLYEGSLLIKDMPRLIPSVYNDEGKVDVKLSLGTDSEGTRFCRVELSTRIQLPCQRCLEPYTYEIISDFVHGIVYSEKEVEHLSEQYEPVMARDGLLFVTEMIEDELILKLPIVPMHGETECKVQLPLSETKWKEDDSEQNPFEKLRVLKQETKKEV